MVGSGLILVSEKDMGTSSEEDDLYKWSIYSIPLVWIQCKLGDVLWGAVLCEVGWDFKATTAKLSPKPETSLYWCHRAFSLVCA